jgi:hypothetical protein
MDCGARPEELEHFARGIHRYAEWQIFPELSDRLVLCDFCEVDFQSYWPDYFGLPENAEPGERRQFIRELHDLQMADDWVCPKCGKRKPFADLVLRARRTFGGGSPDPAES